MGNKESQAAFEASFAAEFPEFGADGERIEYAPGFLDEARARREKEWRAQQAQQAHAAKKKKKKSKKKKKKNDNAEADTDADDSEIDDAHEPDSRGPVLACGDADDADETGDSDAYEDMDGESWETDTDVSGGEPDAADGATAVYDGDRSALYDEAYCYTAIFPYTAENDTELSFGAGVIVTVVETAGDWWRGISGGATGWFPALFVTPTPHRFEPPADYAEYCAHQALAAFQQQGQDADHKAREPTYAELQYGVDAFGYTNLGPHELAYATAPLQSAAGGEPVYDEQHPHLSESAVDSYVGLREAYAQPQDAYATTQTTDSYAGLQTESSSDPADDELARQWRQYEADKAAFEEEERRAYAEWEAQMRVYEEQQEKFRQEDAAAAAAAATAATAASVAHDHWFRQRTDDYEELPALPSEVLLNHAQSKFSAAAPRGSEAPYATVTRTAVVESDYSEISELAPFAQSHGAAPQNNPGPPLPPPRHASEADDSDDAPQSNYLVPVKIASSQGLAPSDAAPLPRGAQVAAAMVKPYHIGVLPAPDASLPASSAPKRAGGLGSKQGHGQALTSELLSKAVATGMKPRPTDLERGRAPEIAEKPVFAPLVALKKAPVPVTPVVVPVAEDTQSGAPGQTQQMPLPPSAVRKKLQQQVPAPVESTAPSAVAPKAPVSSSSPVPVPKLRTPPPPPPPAPVPVPVPAPAPVPVPNQEITAVQEPVRAKPLRTAPVAPKAGLGAPAAAAPAAPAAAAVWPPPPPPAKVKASPSAAAVEDNPAGGSTERTDLLLPPPPPVAKKAPVAPPVAPPPVAPPPVAPQSESSAPVVLPARKAPPPPAGVQPARKAPPPPAGVKPAVGGRGEGADESHKKRRRRKPDSAKQAEPAATTTTNTTTTNNSSSRPPPPSRSVPLPPSRPVPQPPSVLAALDASAPTAAATPPAEKKSVPPPPPPSGGKGVPKAVVAVDIAAAAASSVADAPKPAPKPRARATTATDATVSAVVQEPASTAAAAATAPKPQPRPRAGTTAASPTPTPTPTPTMAPAPSAAANSARPPRPTTAAVGVSAAPVTPKPPKPTAKAVGTAVAPASASSAAKATQAAVQIRRALVAHTATKPGELSFKAGDVLVQMTEADGKGVCRGMLQNGVVGCYPAAKVVKFAG